MEFFKALQARVSTRSFAPRPVPEEAVGTVLNAARYAPVGMHRFDTLHLSVITDKDILETRTPTPCTARPCSSWCPPRRRAR